MRVLGFSLSALVCAWLLVIGCDDTRPVVGLEAGGQPEGGEPAMLGGSKASDAGSASLAGHDGEGGTAGQGGASTPLECPADFFEADGQDCTAFGEGFECDDGAVGPCAFGNSITCANGKWERQEAFPGDCGGAGGVGGDSTAGGVGGSG